jgi:CBS domain-containing protein
VPLLLVEELMRTDVPLVKNTDDLARVVELFARFDVTHLPVSVGGAPDRVIGLVSRSSLIRRYQVGLAQTE